MSVHDAGTFARAWLAVDIASGKDADNPVLDRTIAIEHYASGVRLVATDGYVILRTWVPSIDQVSPGPEPEIDEAPELVAVAIDAHRRAESLCKHLVSLTKDEGSPPEEIRLSLGRDVRKAEGQLSGMDATYVMLDHPDHERVQLRTYEGTYPDWRPLASEHRKVRTDVVALNPDVMGRLAKLGKLGFGAIRWGFGGAERAATVTAEGHEGLVVEGLAMPVRWEWETPASEEAA